MRALISLVTVAGAAALMGAASHPTDAMVERAGPPPPPRGRAKREPSAPHRGTRYEPKVPTTAHDFARLEAAERKRARKGAIARANATPAHAELSPGNSSDLRGEEG